jgi:cell wall-associated NlpC family hydrolase
VTLDPRIDAFRPDLADARLAGQVAASRYAAGEPARIRVGQAPVRREPAADAAIDTFFHYGESVQVFERGAQFCWCQSGFDRYVGYVAAAHIASVPADAPTHYVAPLAAHLYEAADLRRPAIDLLPRHSAVTVAESGLVTRGCDYARLAGGGFLPLACLAATPPRSPGLAAAARRYLGCPYLWGGRSLLGLDCSGLVQSAFRDLGVTVLRDSDLQANTIGTPVTPGSAGDLQPDDLLFLPGHVLIHAGSRADGGADSAMVIHADGASMQVREEPLSGFLARTGLTLAALTVRRPASPAAG